MHSLSASRPRLMVGVPTSYLSPRLPFPPNVDYNVSVGVELAPGIGVSLDGKALLVGPEGHEGQTKIDGHLADGTYKNRDSVVLRSGEDTQVDGFQDWQDYALQGSGQDFSAEGDSSLRSFTVKTTDDGFRVSSDYSARSWTVRHTPEGSVVESDFEGGEKFMVSGDGGQILIDSNLEDQDFTITEQSDGSKVIDGKYATDDFVFRATDSGHELKGHYPQQHFRVSYD